MIRLTGKNADTIKEKTRERFGAGVVEIQLFPGEGHWNEVICQYIVGENGRLRVKHLLGIGETTFAFPRQPACGQITGVARVGLPGKMGNPRIGLGLIL